ncbi:Aldose 1-epimerase [Microbulbifer aggregans]|uniref:Aldose 1-epimerase n=1 Tax=Microbulbifer aggregans TaxID=1769779 RepID=A0A1C9W5S9_9GAMM|nr:aldose 1-epimerase family protein [Microbulbifer aggregans]AOS96501.1 Aldose 1-epimerase [Microbulbifer aggregans]
MASLILKNDRLTVAVREKGAELFSLVDHVRQRELMWRGDPDVWAGTAPILFPVVGRLKGGGYHHDGHWYAMRKHGFAKTRDFSLVSADEHSLTLVLQADELTRAQYPFEFLLQVTFRLEESGLSVRYGVENRGEGGMPFSLGSHPAFALPGETMEASDSYLEFECEEQGGCYCLEGDLLSENAGPSPIVGRRLSLGRETFARDALILKDIRSRKVGLFARGERLLEFDTGGAAHLGVWAKPNAPYVCIEPWLSTDDSPSAPADLADKPGFITLQPDEVFETGYRIHCA